MRATRSLFVDRELSDRERKNFEILNIIRKQGPIARTEISRLTGINIVTVSNYMEQYIKEGIVTEEGYDTSTGGRKPMMVGINQKWGCVIGIGFDMTDIIGTITDLKGEIIFRSKKRRKVETGKYLVENLMNMVQELIDGPSVEKQRIRGIGLAVSGIIDSENRTVRWPGPLGTPDSVVSVSLWDEFTNRFGLPVVIENDADCAAFGEQWLALSSEYKDVIYMYSGVSCGIMVNGQIYKGASGCAGELGILNQDALNKYDWRKESFNLGRWDMELGMLQNIEALQKRYPDSKIFEIANNNPKDVTFVTIVQAANAKDELAMRLLTKAGEDLGKKIAFLVNLFNPQIVVIGGGVERGGPLLLDTLRKTVKEWAFEEVTRALKIMPAQLSENAVPLGAASLVIKNIFEQM